MIKRKVNKDDDSNEDFDIINELCVVDHSSASDIGEFQEGGWGWVVVFASFMVHVLADGVTYSFGVLTTEFISHFDASREAVGWMASILVGMTLSAGPIASILCNKFGFRSVTITGAFISGIGFCVPFFYPELWSLYLFTSVISGFGFGLVYLPSIVTVSLYFQKKRALAIGLAVCGSGIGTFIFSPLIELLIESYGWRGTMLIVGGLIFNCLACGAVYRPLRFYEDRFSGSYSQKSSVHKPSMVDEEIIMEHNEKTEKFKTDEKEKSSIRDFTSVANVSGFPTKNKNDRFIYSAPDMQKMIHISNTSSKRSMLKVSLPHLLMSSQISLQLDHSIFQQSNSKIHDQTSIISEKIQLAETSSNEIKHCINDIFDFDLLKHPLFLLFAFSNFFTSIGFNAPFLYAKDRALQMGIENNRASFLISSIGIGNTVGRVVFGYLSTNNFVNRLQLYNASLMTSGFVVMLSCFAVTYGWMVIYTLGFGLLTGTYVTLTSIVLVDLLGIEKLNASFGMTMVAQGAAVFIGPPLAGWIYDITKSFDCSFWVCGAFLSLSGIMLYFVYCSKEFRKKSRSDKCDTP